jgi:hypothetical protein
MIRLLWLVGFVGVLAMVASVGHAQQPRPTPEGERHAQQGADQPERASMHPHSGRFESTPIFPPSSELGGEAWTIRTKEAVRVE